jgi:excisionase family DNA binding protein
LHFDSVLAALPQGQSRSATRALQSIARGYCRVPPMETLTSSSHAQLPLPETERLAYSIKESADLLGIDYFSVYRLIQRGKLRACRALRGKLLVPRSELLRLLKTS